MYKFFMIIVVILQINIYATPNIKEVLFVSEPVDGVLHEDGSGLYADIVKKIYEPLNIKVSIKIYPYNRAVQQVQSKNADAWLGSYVDEEDFALYPKYYFDEDIVTAMVKKEKFPTFDGMNSLLGKNICWLRGYDYDDFIDVDIIQHERNNRKSILLSLENDRFDIYLDAEYDIKEAIKKYNFDASKYSFYEVLSLKLYPAFRNDERGKQLRDMWDAQFEKFLKDGSLKEIYIKNELLDFYLYN